MEVVVAVVVESVDVVRTVDVETVTVLVTSAGQTVEVEVFVTVAVTVEVLGRAVLVHALAVYVTRLTAMGSMTLVQVTD